MNAADLALLITAIATPLGAIWLAVRRAWQTSILRAATEQQAKTAIEAKNDEIAELNRDKADLRQQNADLWRLLEGLTK